MRPKTVPHKYRLASSETRRCEECGAATKAGKPFCSTHVTRCDYVKVICRQISEAELEIAKVSVQGSRAVNLRGLVVHEILAGLAETGAITYRRLIKDKVNLLHRSSHQTTDAFLKRILGARLVKVTLNSRRNEVVSLTPKGLRRRRGIK